MNRNPNNRGPRQLRDCTFQDWADPFERPAPKQKTGVFAAIGAVWIVGLCAWALV